MADAASSVTRIVPLGVWTSFASAVLASQPPAKGGSESRGVLRRWEFLPTPTAPEQRRAFWTLLAASRLGTDRPWSQAMNATPALIGSGPIGRVMRAKVVGAGEGASS
jgi:hypothetical protein